MQFLDLLNNKSTRTEKSRKFRIRRKVTQRKWKLLTRITIPGPSEE